MFEIGSSLREARERRGLSYADVELGTKVRSRYIKALEDERFDILPGPTYTKGFLRAYADYLGLDGNLYIDEFNSRHHDPRRDPESEIYPRSKARTQHRQRRESNIVLIALAAIVAVSSLVFLAWDNSHPSATLPIPPVTSNTSNGGSSNNTSPSSTQTKTVKNQVPRRFTLTVAVSGGDCWVSVHKWRAAGPAAVATNGSSLAGLVVKDGGRVTMTALGPVYISLGSPSAAHIAVNGHSVHVPYIPAGGHLKITRSTISAA
jgi:transcriptional regulator with XRE-family HTH domain